MLGKCWEVEEINVKRLLMGKKWYDVFKTISEESI